METNNSFFTESRKELEQYLQDRLLLMKMQGTDKLSRVVAMLFSVIAIAMVSGLIIMFLSIMAGYFFAERTGSLFKGFAIVTGFYAVLLAVLVLGRKYYEKEIINRIIRIVFEKD